MRRTGIAKRFQRENDGEIQGKKNNGRAPCWNFVRDDYSRYNSGGKERYEGEDKKERHKRTECAYRTGKKKISAPPNEAHFLRRVFFFFGKFVRLAHTSKISNWAEKGSFLVRGEPTLFDFLPLTDRITVGFLQMFFKK